jgi:hypothetical protein
MLVYSDLRVCTVGCSCRGWLFIYFYLYAVALPLARPATGFSRLNFAFCWSDSSDYPTVQRSISYLKRSIRSSNAFFTGPVRSSHQESHCHRGLGGGRLVHPSSLVCPCASPRGIANEICDLGHRETETLSDHKSCRLSHARRDAVCAMPARSHLAGPFVSRLPRAAHRRTPCAECNRAVPRKDEVASAHHR